MQKRVLWSAIGALWFIVCAFGLVGLPLEAAYAAEVHPLIGNYSGTAKRANGSANFTFTVDERGSCRGKIPAPGGKQLDLLGAMQTNGMVVLAASDFGGTNYYCSISGQFKKAADGSVTGTGPFADSSTNTGNETTTWTARRISTPPVKRTITGRVVNSQGVGVPNVIINRSGTTEVRTTDSKGNYTFTEVVPGTYTITAKSTELTLSPATRSVIVSNANVTVPPINALFKISGRVLLPNGFGVANVRVTRSGSTAAVLTNARGEFSFTSVPSGKITVSVSRTGLVFTPASRPVTLTTVNVANVNFATSYSITGRVVNSAGTGIAGVTITRTGDGRTVTTTTNATGNYSFTGLGSSSFFVTPTRTGLTFTPFTQRATTTTGNVVVPNFRAGFTVTGRVTTSAGVGIANVRITRSGSSTAVLTNSSGTYTFTDVAAGNVVLVPTLAGFTFAPTSRTIAVSTAPVTAPTFIGTPTTPQRRIGVNTLLSSTVSIDTITLLFDRRLDADSATDASNYSVIVNGERVAVESVSFKRASSVVVLGLPTGSLRSGDSVTLEWNNLQDTQGHTLSGSATLVP